MGFILMYAFVANVFSIEIILIAAGVFLIEVFGGCYNDYHDYEEDLRNGRKEKWTVSGLMTRAQVKAFSFSVLALGLVFFFAAGFGIIGLYYGFVMWAYSHPKIHLKGHHIFGYAVLASSWLLMPLAMNILFSIPLTTKFVILTLFFYFQYLYLLSQKDSTDLKDRTNLFIDYGWWKALGVCSIFAVLALTFLLGISLSSLALMSIWAMNLTVKLYHGYAVSKHTITRNRRSKLVLLEFSIPYLYSIGGIW